MFDPGVKRAAAGTDRAVLTEVTHRRRDRTRCTRPRRRVRIDGVGDQTGKIALVATTFTMTVKAPTAAGPLTIRRRTELTFANEFGKLVRHRVPRRRCGDSLGATTTSSTATTSSPIGATT